MIRRFPSPPSCLHLSSRDHRKCSIFSLILFAPIKSIGSTGVLTTEPPISRRPQSRRLTGLTGFCRRHSTTSRRACRRRSVPVHERRHLNKDPDGAGTLRVLGPAHRRGRGSSRGRGAAPRRWTGHLRVLFVCKRGICTR